MLPSASADTHHRPLDHEAARVIRVRRIEPADPLYHQALALREEEILRPLGMDLAAFHREFPGIEQRLEHFVATIEVLGIPRVVGCASLLPNDPAPGAGRMMQMAVSRQRQREGIGTMLVSALEQRAFGELGLTELASHVPLASVGFLASLGWTIETAPGAEFVEGGVPHRRMVLRPAAAPHPAPNDLDAADEEASDL